jgi:hypothetical protein
MEGLAQGKQWGILTTNDCLRTLGRNTIGPVGDIYWSPVNMQNSERLLDTESIQDQPIDATPAAKKRSLLDTYQVQFRPLFRDCMGRYLMREKREIAPLTPIFGPLLRSMLAAQELGAPEGAVLEDGVRDSIVGRALSAMEHVAGQWIDPDTATEQMFRRTVRTIHIHTQRAIAAAIAERELQ